MHLLGEFVEPDIFVGGNESETQETTSSYEYVTSVEDLNLGSSTMQGIWTVGFGLIVSLLVVSVIGWLRRG